MSAPTSPARNTSSPQSTSEFESVASYKKILPVAEQMAPVGSSPPAGGGTDGKNSSGDDAASTTKKRKLPSDDISSEYDDNGVEADDEPLSKKVKGITEKRVAKDATPTRSKSTFDRTSDNDLANLIKKEEKALLNKTKLGPGISRLEQSLRHERTISYPQPFRQNPRQHSTTISQPRPPPAAPAPPVFDVFTRKKLHTDTAKVSASRANPVAPSSIRVWKDASDPKVTWKVIPKSTPKMKHKGSFIDMANLLLHPYDHPDIEVKTYEEDDKCWLVRIEEIEHEVREGRRKEMWVVAKRERAQKAKKEREMRKEAAKEKLTKRRKV